MWRVITWFDFLGGVACPSLWHDCRLLETSFFGQFFKLGLVSQWSSVVIKAVINTFSLVSITTWRGKQQTNASQNHFLSQWHQQAISHHVRTEWKLNLEVSGDYPSIELLFGEFQWDVRCVRAARQSGHMLPVWGWEDAFVKRFLLLSFIFESRVCLFLHICFIFDVSSCLLIKGNNFKCALNLYFALIKLFFLYMWGNKCILHVKLREVLKFRHKPPTVKWAL